MTVVDYYNEFRGRLIEDYELRNRRVTAALDFANANLDGADTILDVGCGIGWTTHELNGDTTGLDISPVLTITARNLFPTRRFITADFTEWNPEPFDAVVMIDVYEHFPRPDRHVIHKQIRRTGATRVLLTAPTPEAMQYARDNGIALQPVDEDVTDADIAELAADIDGQIVIDRRVTIWRPNDYRHVLITC